MLDNVTFMLNVNKGVLRSAQFSVNTTLHLLAAISLCLLVKLVDFSTKFTGTVAKKKKKRIYIEKNSAWIFHVCILCNYRKSPATTDYD